MISPGYKSRQVASVMVYTWREEVTREAVIISEEKVNCARVMRTFVQQEVWGVWERLVLTIVYSLCNALDTSLIRKRSGMVAWLSMGGVRYNILYVKEVRNGQFLAKFRIRVNQTHSGTSWYLLLLYSVAE